MKKFIFCSAIVTALFDFCFTVTIDAFETETVKTLKVPSRILTFRSRYCGNG